MVAHLNYTDTTGYSENLPKTSENGQMLPLLQLFYYIC